MDNADEGGEERQLIFGLGMAPVVAPKSNRLPPWEHDDQIHKKRNELK